MAAPKPGPGRAIVLPALIAAAVLGGLGAFLGTFLGDTRTLALGLGAGWVAYAVGRVVAHVDAPRGYGASLGHVLTGVAIGFAGSTLLRALFVEGPGWPWTPWWALMAGCGFGIYRAHRPLVRQARDRDAASRWLGLFHPKDLEALGVLVAGYLILGVAGFLILDAFRGLLPGGGQMLAVAAAAYALHGARLLLAFAAEERAASGRGVVHWLKANALQNALVVLLLVAYAAFRDDLARSIPFYPLVEYGLGIALFGFVLARLRGRLRREGSLLATASEARDHERVVSELREPEHDAVARPVTRFVESGQGVSEYRETLLSALPVDDPRRDALAQRVAEHREPPRLPPLPIEWAFAAGLALALGLGLAGIALGLKLLKVDMPFPLAIGLLLFGFGVYAQQDVARAHHRPWLSVGIAAIGTTLLFLDFLLFASALAPLGSVPRIVWGIVLGISALLLGIPAIGAWKHDKRLREGRMADARKLAPPLEHATELQKARKLAATMMLSAFVVLLPLPWLAGWLEGRALLGDLPAFLRDLLAVMVWAIAAFGAFALVRFYGLTRGRAQLIARERAKRDARLTLHRDLMQTIERTSP